MSFTSTVKLHYICQTSTYQIRRKWLSFMGDISHIMLHFTSYITVKIILYLRHRCVRRHECRQSQTGSLTVQKDQQKGSDFRCPFILVKGVPVVLDVLIRTTTLFLSVERLRGIPGSCTCLETPQFYVSDGKSKIRQEHRRNPK